MGHGVEHQEGHLPFRGDLPGRRIPVESLISEIQHIPGLVLEIQFGMVPVLLEITVSGNGLGIRLLLRTEGKGCQGDEDSDEKRGRFPRKHSQTFSQI